MGHRPRRREGRATLLTGAGEGAQGGPSPGFASLATSNARLRETAARWQWRVNGSLCGDSPFGLWAAEGGGLDSYELKALADAVKFGEPNDGAVPTAACHGSTHVEPVGRTYLSVRYTAALNHYDLTCRHGDGWLPWLLPYDARRPCAWYVRMAELALEARAPS